MTSNVKCNDVKDFIFVDNFDVCQLRTNLHFYSTAICFKNMFILQIQLNTLGDILTGIYNIIIINNKKLKNLYNVVVVYSTPQTKTVVNIKIYQISIYIYIKTTQNEFCKV